MRRILSALVMPPVVVVRKRYLLESTSRIGRPDGRVETSLSSASRRTDKYFVRCGVIPLDPEIQFLMRELNSSESQLVGTTILDFCCSRLTAPEVE